MGSLKDSPTKDGSVVFLVAKNAVGDNLGGFYRWDPTSTLAEDAQFMNVIKSNFTNTGRWIRIFQKVKVYPHGILVNNGGVRTFYAPGITNAGGEVSINLTEDNTPTGTPLFTEVWLNQSKATTESTSVSNSVQSYVKSTTADLKQTTHGYYKPNAVTITVGLLFNPVAAVGAGVNVQFKIEGV